MKTEANNKMNFSSGREFSLTLQKFSPGYESTKNIFFLFFFFFFFDKIIIFRLKKETGDIQSAYV